MKNFAFWNMRRMGLVKTDVSEEAISSIFRVVKSVGEEKR
jgi:hypothetical protein